MILMEGGEDRKSMGRFVQFNLPDPVVSSTCQLSQHSRQAEIEGERESGRERKRRRVRKREGEKEGERGKRERERVWQGRERNRMRKGESRFLRAPGSALHVAYVSSALRPSPTRSSGPARNAGIPKPDAPGNHLRVTHAPRAEREKLKTRLVARSALWKTARCQVCCISWAFGTGSERHFCT